MARRALYFLIFTIFTAFLIVGLFSYFVAQRIEFETRRTVEKAVPVQDVGWLRTDVDGLQVRLFGDAPTDEARFRVIESVTSQVNVKRIHDEITAPEVNLDEPELSLELVQNSHMSSVIGLLPREPSPAPIFHAMERANPTSTPLNLVGDLEGAVEEGWDKKIEFLSYVVANLPNVKISANEDVAHIESVAASQDEAKQKQDDINARIPDGYKVELDISAPRPLVVPFQFRYSVKDNATQVSACSATDDKDLALIEGAFEGVEENAFANCKLGLGAPTEDWGLLISELHGKLKPLKNYEFTVRDNQVVLDYSDQEDPANVEKVKSTVLGALPAGFGFAANSIVTVKSIEELAAEGSEALFEIETHIDGGADVKGVVASESMQANVKSLVAAKFGTEKSSFELDYVEGLPGAWEKNIFATLTAVGNMDQAHAVLSESFLSLEGSVPTEEKRTEVLDQLRSELGDLALNEDIAVLEIEQVTALVDPNDCVKRVSDIMNEAPIQFEPSSSRISASSESTITSISQVLHECRGHNFEIGGHTDSKGSEDVNQRISEERAVAVMNAILAQALEYGKLEAKGFGESMPIASNDTEEGRAANRRIEIRLSGN